MAPKSHSAPESSTQAREPRSLLSPPAKKAGEASGPVSFTSTSAWAGVSQNCRAGGGVIACRERAHDVWWFGTEKRGGGVIQEAGRVRAARLAQPCRTCSAAASVDTILADAC